MFMRECTRVHSDAMELRESNSIVVEYVMNQGP